MVENLKNLYSQAITKDFNAYFKSTSALPKLDSSKLDLKLYIANERQNLGIWYTGDASMLITYRNRPGAVLSMELDNSSQGINIVQLQGAKQEGYRINSGLKWDEFFADKIQELAVHPEAFIKRLTMPNHFAIPGYIYATIEARDKYETLAKRLGMSLSKQEDIWIKDIR